MAAPARRVDSLESAETALASTISGRKWIVASSLAVGRAGIERLRSLGAEDVIVVAGTRGVGDLPDSEILYLGLEPTTDLMSAIRATEAALADPPSEVVAAVDRFDPAGDALVIGDPVFGLSEFLGRHVYGTRPRSWAELEDKTTADALWDEAGIERSPSAVVPLAEARTTATELATEHGTVWAADNSRGWHGGGEYTRWVPTGTEEAAVDWFTGRADVVRVMPFLDGIPCSIHGFVTGTGVATFRPYEMIVLRRADRSGFLYAGGGTFWDPPIADREAMRWAARSVGRVLDRLVGYRGPYSVDGIMTADGFLPTEVNPRQSRGLGDQAAAVEALSLGGLTRGVIAGSFDVDPVWLETTIVEAADGRRNGRANTSLPILPPDIEPQELLLQVGSAVPTDEDGTGRLEIGGGHIGSTLMLRFDPDRVAPGPSVAPLVTAAHRFARESWGLPVPETVPAPDLRG
jgi:hypothetical protein